MSNTTTITGYVVLYIQDGEPWLLGNKVFPSKTAAGAAAKRKRVSKYEINAADIELPRIEIVN
jgi:hypothetical protein